MGVKDIKHIAIIGLGLIGGSLAKALKAKGYNIIGIDTNKKTISLAKQEKTIDIGYTKLNKKSLIDVDIVFIATPLDFISGYLKQISELQSEKAIIVTDTGSTKAEICNYAKKLLYPCFIGGHPMAGTEHSGYEYSNKNLFKNKSWVLIPTVNDKQSIKILQEIITIIGAKPVLAKPLEHDLAVALISHLPLLISVALCRLVMNTKNPSTRKLAISLAASGFKDMTRIAGGNPEMNSNLLKSNLPNILKLIPEYSKEVEVILSMAKNNPRKLFLGLKTTKSWRNTFN